MEDGEATSRDPTDTLLTYDIICPVVGYIRDHDDLSAALGEEPPCDYYAYQQDWQLHPNSSWTQKQEAFLCVGKRRRTEFSRTSSDVRPHVVEASVDIPVRAMRYLISEEGWSLHDALGGRGPSPPRVMKRFHCEQCAEAVRRDQEKDERLDREMREEDVRQQQLWTQEAQRRQKRKRAEKEQEQSRRLAFLSSDSSQTNDMAEAAQLVKRLKVAELKRVCAANQLLVSGSKGALEERILGCKKHGRLGSSCPLCAHSKLELRYAPNSPAEPHAIQCRHMKGMGRPCPFQRTFTPATKATVLAGQLVDSAEGDLRRVGLLE